MQARASRSTPSSQHAFGTLAGGSGVGSLPSGAIATISSLLMSELADALNLPRFEAGLFQTGGTVITNQLITNAYGMMTGALNSSGHAYTMFTGFDTGAIITQLETAGAAYFASQLVAHVVIPQHPEGATGEQIGSSVGALVGTAILPELPVIGAFIGSFVGGIAGSIVGDLFGNDPESHGRVVFLADGRFYPDPHSFYGDHGANGATFMNIATYTGNVVNALADYAGVAMNAFPVADNPISNEFGLQLRYTQDGNDFITNDPYTGLVSVIHNVHSADDLAPLVDAGIMEMAFLANGRFRRGNHAHTLRTPQD